MKMTEAQRAKRVKMTEIQKIEWKQYQKECREFNIEPSLADFLHNDVPDFIQDRMTDTENAARELVLAAFAGD